jgi:hypothetical protein
MTELFRPRPFFRPFPKSERESEPSTHPACVRRPWRVLSPCAQVGAFIALSSPFRRVRVAQFAARLQRGVCPLTASSSSRPSELVSLLRMRPVAVADPPHGIRAWRPFVLTWRFGKGEQDRAGRGRSLPASRTSTLEVATITPSRVASRERVTKPQPAKIPWPLEHPSTVSGPYRCPHASTPCTCRHCPACCRRRVHGGRGRRCISLLTHERDRSRSRDGQGQGDVQGGSRRD